MKLRNLLDSEPALGRLLQLPVSARMAYQLVVQFKVVEPHIRAGRDAILGLYRKYGDEKPQPDGINVMYQVPPDKPDKIVPFQKELAELLDTDVDVQVKPISMADLGDVRISAADLIVLEWLLA